MCSCLLAIAVYFARSVKIHMCYNDEECSVLNALKISCVIFSCYWGIAGIPAMRILIYRQGCCACGQHMIGVDYSGQGSSFEFLMSSFACKYQLCDVWLRKFLCTFCVAQTKLVFCV